MTLGNAISAHAAPELHHVGSESPQLVTRPRADLGQLGLFTLGPVAAWATIVTVSGPLVERPSRTSIQVDARRHMEVTVIAAMNHSCAPSTEIVVIPGPVVQLAVRALRNLAPGEELTFNYLTTEAAMHEPFDCRCGAPACFGRIAGFHHASPAQRIVLGHQAAPYLRSTERRAA
jgi:hypothetical protein